MRGRRASLAMGGIRSLDEIGRRAWEALAVWGVFIVFAVIVNATIPFALGVDVRAWTYSGTKSIIMHLIVYALLFMVVPLILTKGLKTARKIRFLVPLVVAVVGITLRGVMWPAALLPTGFLAIPVLAYLHWRFDLSDLGVRSRGWRGDTVAILLMGLLVLASTYLQPAVHYSFAVGSALAAALDRLFLNPASSVENLFYFGFLTERLSHKTGRWFTPPLIGLMYTAHEMSNPEYWYGGLPFAIVFVGITITSAIYLWRRSVVVVWLSDGLGRFVSNLFV
jgi:hypothetical protein